MNLNVTPQQMAAIRRGQTLAGTHDTAALIAAAMNAIQGDSRITDEDAAKAVAMLTVLFSIVTEPGEQSS